MPWRRRRGRGKRSRRKRCRRKRRRREKRSRRKRSRRKRRVAHLLWHPFCLAISISRLVSSTTCLRSWNLMRLLMIDRPQGKEAAWVVWWYTAVYVSRALKFKLR